MAELWNDLAQRLTDLQETTVEIREGVARQSALLTTLLGNGQPGRLQIVEAQVKKNTSSIDLLRGIGTLIATLLALAGAAVSLFRH